MTSSHYPGQIARREEEASFCLQAADLAKHASKFQSVRPSDGGRGQRILFLRMKAATYCSSPSPLFFFCGWQAGRSGGNSILSLKRLSIL